MTGEKASFVLPSLQTGRLLLRLLRLSDAADMFEYASDPEVTRFVFWSPHSAIDATREFLNQQVQLARHGELTSWAVEHVNDRKMIGMCGFVWWRPEHGKAEIAYAISRKYWNKGLVTEAVTACIEYGFEVLGLNRIEARCMPDNIGSERVMQKCGMKYEGTFRQTMLVKGKYIDLKMYGILKEQYDNFKKATAATEPVFRIEGKLVNLRTTMVKDLADYQRWQSPDMPGNKYDGPWYPPGHSQTLNGRRRFLHSAMQPPFTRIEVDLKDGTHIGSVVVQYDKDDPHETGIGIDFPEDTYWGKGYGAEALTLWVDYLFKERNLTRIGFTTWSGNPRMIALGKKLGFSQEGCIRNSCLVEGKFYDRVNMGILREEWEQRKMKP